MTDLQPETVERNCRDCLCTYYTSLYDCVQCDTSLYGCVQFKTSLYECVQFDTSVYDCVQFDTSVSDCPVWHFTAWLCPVWHFTVWLWLSSLTLHCMTVSSLTLHCMTVSILTYWWLGHFPTRLHCDKRRQNKRKTLANHFHEVKRCVSFTETPSKATNCSELWLTAWGILARRLHQK